MPPYKHQKQYRLPGWDYGAAGYYFATICVGDRKNLLDRMVGARVELSAIGLMAEKYWSEIPKHFPGVSLDYFVIMPNHVHGIIVLDNQNGKKEINTSLTENNINIGRNAPRRVQINGKEHENAPRRVPTIRPLSTNSLSSIINHFKGGVKKFCNQNGYSYFMWQPRFHDHIIRDEEELNNVRQYIEYNPDQWQWGQRKCREVEKIILILKIGLG